MAENTQLTVKQQSILDFKKIVDNSETQKMLYNVLGENKGTFATSLVEVFTNDTQLQGCKPKQVIQEAIKAATLKLPLNKQLGYAYVLVFNNWDKTTRTKVPTPQLVIGYKGYIQLAMRSAQYRNINCDIIYEGEMRKKNKLTGEVDLEGEKLSDKVVGYFAHFELINGFQKTFFMTLEQMAEYALKNSPSFKGKQGEGMTTEKLCSLAQEQAEKGATQGQVGWVGDFNAMAMKTVLRRLLSKYGLLSIEMQNALDSETIPTSENLRDEVVNQPKVTFDAQVITDNVQDAQAEELKQPDLGSLND